MTSAVQGSTSISAPPVQTVDALLRAPVQVAERALYLRGVRPLAATALTVILAGSALFGAVVGSYRGGGQIVYGAVKTPLALLATFVIACPALHVIAAAFGARVGYRTTLTLVLAAGARASLVLVAAAPPLWLLVDVGVSYEAVKLAAALSYALAGFAALGLLLRGVRLMGGGVGTVLAFVTVYLLVGAQTAWILRPYIGDPADATVPFLVARKEGGVADALSKSAGAVLGGRGRHVRR